jgi:hypothetical protein
VWLKAPNTGAGVLEWDGFVSAEMLNRGLWRVMLGLVLDGIGRSSLPGILASADSTARLPRSSCTGVSVARGGKLVLDGRLESFELDVGGGGVLDGSMPRGQSSRVRQGPLDYTLRLGLKPSLVQADGTLVERAWTGEPQGRGGLRSILVWDMPELKLSLGEGFLAKLLPQLWVPVLSSSGVVLPRSVELERVSASDAGDGVTASGTIALSREDFPDIGGALTVA